MTKNKPDDIRLLEEKITQLRKKEADLRGERQVTEIGRASRIGLRIGVELLSAVLVGAALGYVADRLLGSTPWMMVVFLLLGGAAGVLNVYRLAQSEDNME